MITNKDLLRVLEEQRGVIIALNHNSTSIKESVRDIGEFMRDISTEQRSIREDFVSSMDRDKLWFKLVLISFIILAFMVGGLNLVKLLGGV